MQISQTATNSQLRILILGGSGLVGQSLIRQALALPGVTQVCAPTRRALTGFAADARLHNPIRDFNQLQADDAIWQADVLLCALGTTMALAGSQAAFYQSDHDLVLRCAAMARAAGVNCMVYNSSLGAALKASSFYLRVKAETERDLAALNFSTLGIVRPALLDNEGQQRPDHRSGEAIALRVLRPLRWLLPARYRPVGVSLVAGAMLRLAQSAYAGNAAYAGKAEPAQQAAPMPKLLILESEQLQG
ncbi:NAD-dependent dehydratase [Undibacterium sp. CY7W]|uniref:NAD-dependent dehydratase n=1 Tax=Undibacterium rugosum TaxID=2762291 RepID=A0A923I4K3_9BURK|nr:NAD-dependent dehydratase [Undibacterium rugosum]MBC3936250.1 NAD-dependent dehydratase [Undibacterium rugosum]